MKIRAIILAMLAVLCLSLGASAGEGIVKYINEGVIRYTLPLQAFDTADYIAGGLANDSVGPLYGPTFDYYGPFNQIDYRFFQTIADTCTAVALAADSIILFFQSKTDNDSDLTWWTHWTTAVFDLAAFGGTTALRVTIPADSMENIGSLFRFGYYYINEEDSMTSAAELFYTADSLIDPLQELTGVVFFRESVNLK